MPLVPVRLAVFFFASSIALIFLFVLSPRPEREKEEEKERRTAPRQSFLPGREDNDREPGLLRSGVDEGVPAVTAHSPAAEHLGAPDNDIVEDIGLVVELLLDYRLLLKGETFPMGTNDEITQALAGKNREGIVLLPPGHRSIDNEGNLTDPWKTPYFFHAISSVELEVRSAGPDRSFYTEDDTVISSTD